MASRRKSEQIIANNLVKINGRVAKLGDRVNPNTDKITLNGSLIRPNKIDKYYIMLHKPRGYVTTMSDEKGRKCVADLVKDITTRVYPVGRLDKDSEGLLLMTNDGNFANNIIHPSKDIWKTYRLTVKSKVNEEQLISLCVGIEIDGRETSPAKVNVITEEPGRTVLEISIKEGRNRQIRKMCEQVGLEPARLKRISIGKLKLGMLPAGKWRNLTEKEINNF